MDPNTYVNVDFYDVVLPSKPTPTSFKKLVRCFFLLASDGQLLCREDMQQVLAAWLFDELGESPVGFNFIVVP